MQKHTFQFKSIPPSSLNAARNAKMTIRSLFEPMVGAADCLLHILP